MKKLSYSIGFLFILCMVIGSFQFASAGNLPKILRLGTMPVGTTVNTSGIGLADIISKHTPMQVKVVPVAVEVIWIPMMANKEMDLGVGNCLEFENAYFARQVYRMVAKKMKVKSFPVRMVAKGGQLQLGFLVRGDSPFKTIADLKGARVPLYPPGSSTNLHTVALLANAGLKPEDVKNVPVSNPLQATRALIDGRADAVDVAINAPMVMEAVTKVHARFLPVDMSAEAVKRMQEVNHQYYAAIPQNYDPNVMKKPIPELTLDLGFVASAYLSDDAVYSLTKAIWENRKELAEKPVLSGWNSNSFVDPERTFFPFHPGAVRYWKEAGLWSQKMDEIQARLLSEEPK